MSESGTTLRQRAGKEGKGHAKKDGGIEITRVKKASPEAQAASTSKQESTKPKVAPSAKKPRPAPAATSTTARIFEVLAVICLLLALLVGIAAYLHHFEPQIVRRLDEGLKSVARTLMVAHSPPAAAKPTEPKKAKPAVVPRRLFTAEELRQHDGTDPSKPILLGILGKVFDVTAGKRFYAKGGSYAFFAGRDASRSFSTGAFDEEGLTDDVSDLEPEQVAAIKEWQTQFETQYTYLGKLVGRFYNEAGKATPALRRVKEKLNKAKIVVNQELEEKQQFPECNSRWTEKDGSTIWCSESSGGIERSWKGFPRQCACVRKKHLDDPRVRAYDGCSLDAHECRR